LRFVNCVIKEMMMMMMMGTRVNSAKTAEPIEMLFWEADSCSFKEVGTVY